MVSDDKFFSPNKFEHSQDSFFQWVFLTDCKEAELLKKRLFLLFCGEKEKAEDKDQVQKTDLQKCDVTTQINARTKKKTKRCDLEIHGIINGEKHVIFLEDKTNNVFCGVQLDAMQVLAKGKKSDDTIVHVVYCTSARLTPQTITDIKNYRDGLKNRTDLAADPVFAFRKDIENAVNDLVNPDNLSNPDSILGQYFGFINDIYDRDVGIANWNNSDFIGNFKKEFFESGANRFYSIEVLGLLDSYDAVQRNDLSITIKRRDDTKNEHISLCWETQKRSKQKHCLRLLKNSDSVLEFGSLYRYFCKALNEPTSGKRYANGKKIIGSWSTTKTELFKAKIKALFASLVGKASL